MLKSRVLNKTFYSICLGISICYPMASLANALYLPFGSAADLGDAFSGGAAIAQDASTANSNPAGLTRLEHQQIVVSATGVTHHMQFDGTTTSPGWGTFSTPSSNSGKTTSTFSGVIPAFYYALPVSKQWALGLSVTSPYGLGDDYPNSVARYYVTYAEAQSADISPNVSYKVNDHLSLGAGFDALYMKLKFEQMYRYSTLTDPVDSSVLNKSSGWGYGWHGGILYEFTPRTRVGLSYHSPIVEDLNGDSKFYVNNNGSSVISTDNLHTTMHLPSYTTLSIYQDVTRAWALMATAEYMEWSFLKNDHEYNVATFAGPMAINVPKNFNDTWRFALGTSYQVSDKWLLRTGAEYDQNPTNNTDRDPLLPSANRYIIGIGAHYQVNKDLGLDAGYAHAFFPRININNVNPASGSTAVGTSRMATDVLGIQVAWNIA